ncbi:MAG: hypothetical protein K0U64_04825, partial [Actinomycetia bacterium]|nr:hypothetical protein [Actinomycetes bacterium]
DDSTATATLKNGRITYRAEATAIESIGTFLSPGLDSYRVAVPSDATTGEQTAALTAVAALSYRYEAPTIVELVSTDSTPVGDFLNRVVVLREDPEAGSNTFTVNDEEQLVVTGTAAQLQSGAIALGDPNTDILQQRTATDVSGTADFEVLSDAASFTDFGLAPASLSGVGEIRSTWNISQSGFGQAVDEIAVSLVGAMSQLPDGGQGRVDFLWNDQLVESVALSEMTELAVNLNLGTEQVQRDNELVASLKYVPPGGKCYPIGLGALVTIDADRSTISGNAGQGLGQGFDRFPQSLGATVPVALGSATGSGAALSQAGSLLAGMQSIGDQQLVASVVSADDFAGLSEPGVITGADTTTITALAAPLGGSNATVVQPDDPEFSAQLSAGYATLQGFADGDRDIALLGQVGDSTPDAGSVLAGFANDAPDQWRNLVGVAYVQFAEGAPTEVTLDIPQSLPTYVWQLIIGAALVVLLVVALLLWARRRPAEES